MTTRVRTGGNIKFEYNEDQKLNHTSSSKGFTDSVNAWSKRPFYKKKKFWLKVLKWSLIIICVIIILALIYRINYYSQPPSAAVVSDIMGS